MDASSRIRGDPARGNEPSRRGTPRCCVLDVSTADRRRCPDLTGARHPQVHLPTSHGEMSASHARRGIRQQADGEPSDEGALLAGRGNTTRLHARSRGREDKACLAPSEVDVMKERSAADRVSRRWTRGLRDVARQRSNAQGDDRARGRELGLASAVEDDRVSVTRERSSSARDGVWWRSRETCRTGSA